MVVAAWQGLGVRGGAGGVLQFLNKVVNVPVVGVGRRCCSWEAVQLLDKVADMPVAVPLLQFVLVVAAAFRIVHVWTNTYVNVVSKTTTTTTTNLSIPRLPFFASPLRVDLSEQPVSGAAQRRRQRRLRSWLRHERMTVAMALAERTHHSTRGQTIARAGVWGRELNFAAMICDPPPHTPAGALQPLRGRARRSAARVGHGPCAAGEGRAARREAQG